MTSSIDPALKKEAPAPWLSCRAAARSFHEHFVSWAVPLLLRASLQLATQPCSASLPPRFSSPVLPHTRGFLSYLALLMTAVALDRYRRPLARARTNQSRIALWEGVFVFYGHLTNCRKPSGWKQYLFVGSQFCRSEVLVRRDWILCSESHVQGVLIWRFL